MSSAQYVNTGRLRALGVTGARRSPMLPAIPTMEESGLSGYRFTSWYGVMAPRATPEVRVIALNGHFRNALQAPEVAARFTAMGAEIIAGPPDEFARVLRADLDKWAKRVKQAGIKAE
jgi:tripartite-type tricarboxylate transporter receptor subunit TctC